MMKRIKKISDAENEMINHFLNNGISKDKIAEIYDYFGWGSLERAMKSLGWKKVKSEKWVLTKPGL